MTENRAPSSRRPFLAAPDAARYFPGGAIEEARKKLTHNLERSAGVALVIGGAGLGKSMLLEVLAAQFGGDRTVLTLAGAQLCTRRALLQIILFQLGLPFRDLTEGELRLSILSHLQEQAKRSSNPAAGRLLLLVDEAESLPVRLLEELRVLTNLAQAGTPLVDLILAGGPSLEERFAEPELETFNQRVTLRCYVAPLGREETFGYVRSQVAAAGANPDELFSQEGLEALYAATDGIPRLINQLGDQLAWLAEQTGRLPIDSRMVQQAWAELQQLPAPWNMDDGPELNQAPQPRKVSPAARLEEVDLASIDLEAIHSEQSELEDSNVIEIGGDLEDLFPTTARSAPQWDASDDNSEDDDESLPASIPFGSSQFASIASHRDDQESRNATSDRSLEDSSAEDAAVEIDVDETVLATEMMLAELSEIDGGDSLLPPRQTSDADDANDPFGSGFDEEEVVIDPYASFESEMLAYAPDVMNSLDLGFAAGLNRVTTVDDKPALATVVYDDPALAACLEDEPIEPTELDEVQVEEETLEMLELEEEELELELELDDAFLSEDDVFLGNDDEEALLPVTARLQRDDMPHQPLPEVVPSKILVLEDDGRSMAEVVSGRQFRRLFSGLEAGSVGS